MRDLRDRKTGRSLGIAAVSAVVFAVGSFHAAFAATCPKTTTPLHPHITIYKVDDRTWKADPPCLDISYVSPGVEIALVMSDSNYRFVERSLVVDSDTDGDFDRRYETGKLQQYFLKKKRGRRKTYHYTLKVVEIGQPDDSAVTVDPLIKNGPA